MFSTLLTCFFNQPVEQALDFVAYHYRVIQFKNMKESLQESLIEEKSFVEEQQQYSPLEKLIDRVDGQGKYQSRSFIIFAAMWFLTACLLLGMNFFFDDSYTCVDPELSDKDACQTYVCSLPNRERQKAIGWHAPSMIFSYGTYLICPDRHDKVIILQDMMFLGSLIGFLVIPFIADNFGSKLSLRIAWGIGTLGVLLTCLSTSPDMLGIGLFLIGFGSNPSITLCFSIISEVCLGKSRQKYAVGVQVAWAFGQISIALVFLSGLPWKVIMYIILGLFVACSISVELFLLESPMFLLKKAPEKALVIFNKMAHVNHREQLELQDMDTSNNNEEKADLNPEQKSLGFPDLFRYKSIRMTSIAIAMIFFGVQVIYYSSALSQNTIGFTNTVNQVVFGVSQAIGYLVCELIVDKVYRKKATLIGLGVSSLFCLVLGVMVIFQTDENKDILKWFETVMLMLTSFTLCCFESILYVYTAELYPTEIRSLGFGWVSLVGIIGSIVSPFAKTIATSISLNSWFVPAVLGLVAWGFSWCLTETHGKPLRDTIEERLDQLVKEKSEMDEQTEDDDWVIDLMALRTTKSLESKSPMQSPIKSPQNILTRSMGYII